MKSLTIRFGNELMKEIKKRAKKNYLSVPELIEDIVRRSMISYRGGKRRPLKIDDRLIAIFSRERRGRKRKLRKKK
jgi:metal-responsive CopG/Arc/MetJ family transcriptional regulator